MEPQLQAGMMLVPRGGFILVSFCFRKVLSDTWFSMRGSGITFPTVNLRKPTQMDGKACPCVLFVSMLNKLKGQILDCFKAAKTDPNVIMNHTFQ